MVCIVGLGSSQAPALAAIREAIHAREMVTDHGDGTVTMMEADPARFDTAIGDFYRGEGGQPIVLLAQSLQSTLSAVTALHQTQSDLSLIILGRNLSFASSDGSRGALYDAAMMLEPGSIHHIGYQGGPSAELDAFLLEGGTVLPAGSIHPGALMQLINSVRRRPCYLSIALDVFEEKRAGSAADNQSAGLGFADLAPFFTHAPRVLNCVGADIQGYDPAKDAEGRMAALSAQIATALLEGWSANDPFFRN